MYLEGRDSRFLYKFRYRFVATKTSLGWELVQRIIYLLMFLRFHGHFFFVFTLKCMSTAVLIFQDGLERAVTFADSKLVLYFISCNCFSFPAVLMTYGVYPARALKQVFSVPCFSELLGQASDTY